jgi:hypothetical protein
MKYTYIKHDISGYYITFDEKFREDLYNNIGSTWEDFLDNKWVLLSDEQVAFKEAHEDATVKEVWEMELEPIPERTLEQAKAEMIAKINEYDRSSNVNGFTVNGTIEGWFTPEERSNYKNSIDAAKLLGIEKLALYLNDTLINVTPTDAEQMLAQIQLYADQCYIITKQHKIDVNALETIAEVDEFNYEAGYPSKLNFNISYLEEEGE